MQRTVIHPGRWVPIDLWLTANRVQRDATLGHPSSIAEVERVVDARRAAARHRGTAK